MERKGFDREVERKGFDREVERKGFDREVERKGFDREVERKGFDREVERKGFDREVERKGFDREVERYRSQEEFRMFRNKYYHHRCLFRIWNMVWPFFYLPRRFFTNFSLLKWSRLWAFNKEAPCQQTPERLLKVFSVIAFLQ